MSLSWLVIDDFHPEFDALRELADVLDYEDVVNPVDGVMYPGIARIEDLGVRELLEQAMHRTVRINHQFMRLSLAGSEPPHWAHHDAVMGKYTLILYMTRLDACKGCTALLEHIEYDRYVPEEVWRRDMNRRECWRVLSECPMAPNRAFIFRSELWHAAMPWGGFGRDAIDGRMILGAFFE